MKKLFALSLALLMLFSCLAGCGQKAEEPAPAPEAPAAEAPAAEAPAAEAPAAEEAGEPDYSDITVAWVSPLVASEFYDYAKAGMEACAEEYGFKTYWTGADDHTSEMMIEAMEACIADGVDAIGTVPLSESAWRPILERCIEEGIPVGAAACEVSDELIVGYVGTDNWNTGWKMIEEAHKAVGEGDINVGVLMSNLDTANQLIQLDAIKAYLEENAVPGGGVVDVRETLGDALKGTEASEMMLQAYPEINVIISLEGVSGPYAAKAAQDLDMEVVVIGMDDSAETLEAIAAGTQYASMAQNCFKWGYYSTKMAFLAAVDRLDEMENTTVDSGVVMVTKDNVDTYAEELFVMP